MKKMSNRTKAGILGWVLVGFGCLTNLHRVVLLLPLWGLVKLGDAADDCAEHLNDKLPVFFSKTLEKMEEKITALGNKKEE